MSLALQRCLTSVSVETPHVGPDSIVALPKTKTFAIVYIKSTCSIDSKQSWKTLVRDLYMHHFDIFRPESGYQYFN